jgi:hypothetical protein
VVPILVPFIDTEIPLMFSVDVAFTFPEINGFCAKTIVETKVSSRDAANLTDLFISNTRLVANMEQNNNC